MRLAEFLLVILISILPSVCIVKCMFVLQPNCTAEIVTIEGKKKILIFSQQKILTGEEVGLNRYPVYSDFVM